MKENWYSGPSQFNKKDYQLLYKIATTGSIRRTLKYANFRDKRFRRTFVGAQLIIQKVFECPFEDIPLYINEKNINALNIIKWRLQLNK